MCQDENDAACQIQVVIVVGRHLGNFVGQQLDVVMPAFTAQEFPVAGDDLLK